MPVVTLLDALRTQRFVFAANRLRDAVGGAALVERLADWAAAVCPPEDVLLTVGGAALLRFADEPTARAALTRLSRRAHDEAPGLEFAAVHVAYQPGGLAAAVRQAHADLPRARAERQPSAPLLGLGVTASCRDTRLPATAIDPDGQPVSAAVAARRRPELLDRSDRLLPPGHESFSRGGPPRRLRFPTATDRLGRTREERGLVGVVHVDVNGVGARVGAWLEQQAAKQDDQAFLDDFRRLSDGLTRLGRAAFDAARDRVIAAIGFDARSGYQVVSRRLGQGFALADDGESLELPLRPLTLGAGDLTFVCDGRLALDLAAAALAAFDDGDVPVLGRVHASAGVAIVPVHAPLFRAYELAADLCDEAKKPLLASSKEVSALDWHVGLDGAAEGLEEVRRRRYRAGERRLTCRPYPLRDAREAGTWRWLAESVMSGPDGLQGPRWRERRNKLRTLRDAARDGPEAVRRALAAWRSAADGLRLPAGLEETGGYLGDATPLPDAIELLDVHLPLGEGAA